MSKLSEMKRAAPQREAREERTPGKVSVAFSSVKSKLSFLRWLDPFRYVDLFVMPRVKKVTKSETVELVVNVLFAFLFAFILFAVLGVLFGTASPLVIVYSASMENTLFRGDVMGLSAANAGSYFGPTVIVKQNIANIPVSSYVTPTYSNGSLTSIQFPNNQSINYEKNGSIVVYTAYPSGLPIIHRSIVKIQALDGNFILTKGDNALTNVTFDADCGNIDQLRLVSQKGCITFYAIPVDKLQGVAFFNIPKVGCIKLWLFDDLLSLISKGKLPSDFRGIC